jgi:chemotaxis protein MotB
MVKWLVAIVLFLAAAVGGLWYRFYRPQEQALVAARADSARLQAELAKCSAQARGLQGQVADLETVRGELQKASTELQARVQEKEAELAALKGTQDELVSGLRKEIENQQVQVERYRDQLKVEMVDELLFDSGEAELKPAGKAVIEKVGQALAKAEGRRIEVQGHTDNVPIQGALAKRFPTNWELSAARAVNVARTLQQSGIDPKRLAATAHSEYEPRVPNDTDEGRRKNRRIEITLGSKTS